MNIEVEDIPIDENPWNPKDDEQERRNRRRSHAAELLSGAGIVDNAGDGAGAEAAASAAASAAINRMSAKQLTEHYEDCIKLSAEGKISAKNAFALHLIDYLAGMVKQDNFGGFQVASSSLDAGAKIYAGRVDAVHQEAYKVLGGLGRSSAADKKGGAASDDDDEGGGGGADDDADEDNRQSAAAKRKAERKRRPKAVIAGNLSRIRLKPTSLRFDVDPLFQQQAAAYDDGGTGELRLNNVCVLDNACEILLDSDASVCIGAPANRPDAGLKQTCALPADITGRLEALLIKPENKMDDLDNVQETDNVELDEDMPALCIAFREFSFLQRRGGNGFNGDATLGFGGNADQSAVLADFVARLPPPEDDLPVDDDRDDCNPAGDFDDDDGDLNHIGNTAMQIDMCEERDAVVVQTADTQIGDSFHPNASRNFVETLRDMLSDRYAYMASLGVPGAKSSGGEIFRLFSDPSCWRKKCKLTTLFSKCGSAVSGGAKSAAIAGSEAPDDAGKFSNAQSSESAASSIAPAASKIRRQAAATAAKAAAEMLLAADAPMDWRRRLAQTRSGHKLTESVIARNMRTLMDLPPFVLPQSRESSTKHNLLSLLVGSRQSFHSATSDNNQHQKPDCGENASSSMLRNDNHDDDDAADAHDLDDDADLNNFGDDAAAYDANGGAESATAAGLTAFDQPFADAFSQAVGGQATQLPLAGGSQAIGSQPLQTLQAPYKVNQLDIAYAKTAKRINISRLKRSMWQLLETEGGADKVATTALDFSQDDDSRRQSQQQQQDEFFDGERSFARLLQKLPPKVGATTAQDLSVSIVFSCLLYLANEKTLHLSTNADLSDMRITHGLPQHEVDLRAALNPRLKQQRQQQQQQLLSSLEKNRKRQATIEELWGNDDSEEDF